MSKLIMTRGLPASGKSTWAIDYVNEDLENRIRINRDTLREMCHGGTFVQGITEDKVIKARNKLVETFLKNDMEVVVDDTNLRRKNLTDLIKIAEKHGASWKIQDFTDVPLEVCIVRDQLRQNDVGEEVIRDLHNRFLKKPQDLKLNSSESVNIEPYEDPDTENWAYIVDVDGTVALMDGRSPYDYSSVIDDKVNWSVVNVLDDILDAGNCKLLFTSGRPESCREDTEKFLEQQFPRHRWELFMRPTDDKRADYIVKLQLFNEHIRRNYDVLGVFDDRKQCVDLWRKLGLTCFQVADGEF